MPTHETIAIEVAIEVMDPEAVAPFGWMLGKPFPAQTVNPAFRNAASSFWHEHLFDPGSDGEDEILWVTYRDAGRVVDRLEAHHLTQQAVVPLIGDIIQVLAFSNRDGRPDPVTIRAFRLTPGVGLCMRPGVWHATRTPGPEATCLMLTRRSTTRDLTDHLKSGSPALESSLCDIPPVLLAG